MKLTDLSIRHSTTVVVLLILILFVGLSAYRTLPREAAPDMPIPYVMVNTRYEGVAPSDIESLITRPIERKIKGMSSIKEMRSVSAEGTSIILVEFDIDEDIDTVLQKVKDKVDLAEPDLPADLEEEPSVEEINIAEMPIMFVTISGDVGLVKLKQIADDLEDEFETIQGVLDAAVVGGLEREIHVEFDPDRLISYGLSASQVIQTVAASNQNTPGGNLKIGEAKYTVKVPAEFEDPRDIYNLVVATRDGNPIYLTDLAVVRDAYKDQDSYSRIDGRQAVTVVIQKRSGENLLNLAEQARKIVDDWDFPPTVSVAITADRSEMVRDMVNDLENNILTALVLVLAVIILFLGGRSALFVALAIPFSMLISFAAIQAFDMTLNMIVLFSLILALGMLVDNAIVIVENIYRHHAMGKTRLQASIDGAREVAWPVTASTATTVAAFAPLLFWPDIMGKFMGYLPKTVIIALTASLFVALVINPALCSRFMSRKHGKEPVDLDTRVKGSWTLRIYRGILRMSLANRILVLVVAFGFFIVTVELYSVFGKGVIFFPETEPNRAYVDLRAPEGTRLEETDAMARRVEAMVAEYPDVEHYTTNVGSMGAGGNPFEGGGGNEPNRARVVIDFVDAEERTSPSSAVLLDLRKRLRGFIGAEIEVEQEEHGPPTGPPINIEITGDDFDVLAHLADEVKVRARQVPGAVDIHDDYIIGRPEIKVEVDKERAALFNLTSQQIGFMVRTAMFGTKVGVYREGEEEYDIIVRLPEPMRQSIEDLRRLQISTLTGAQIPITSVADIKTTSGLGTIKRIDQQRTVTVVGNVVQTRNRTSNDIRSDIEASLQEMNWPAEYSHSMTGENEEQKKAVAFLSKAFLIALLAIALILVTEFNSILRPFIIMLSVVLSLVGVLWGLILTQTPFSIIMTGLGVISLAGIVVNNAIVLIDYVQLLRAEGKSVNDALVEAGLTRFRPVMLTAITTILGLVPMAVGVSFNFRKLTWMLNSESSQWWGPMAVAVIFGLVVSTVLTLLVVPVAYSLIESLIAAAKRVTGYVPEEEEVRAREPEAGTVVSRQM